MNLAIRYDDLVHRKLKVIAAYQGISLNRLMMNMFKKTIDEFEHEHGKLEFPDFA